ncbi:apolipoprotein N-acyltransferase [Nocardioides sp. HDW12B]|uniref:apolipoprotein N-acyltransferase n=1 Tax=Nocardioides sp. HDW12B TaxID=2714939 RepID=UPI001409A706|nr:apolipoprotein N-acyltransferase [Nocardioides sp. HDW12B]QIK66450.1 apolipoprotein N-acyltransferase [Nocardioides sp. HDW12B]
MNLALRTLGAALSGAAAAAAFEPYAVAWLLPVGVLGLTLASRGLRGRRALLVGLAYGVTFMGVLVPWLQVIGVDAWIGLTILEAAFYGLLGVALARVGRLRGWPVWAAGTWVAVDALRSAVPWGGFPWGRLALATVDTPLAPLMSWVGPAGTSFAVALLGTGLAWLVLERPVSLRGAAVVGGLVLLVVAPAAWGPATLSSTAEVRVAAVQGNVPGEGMDAFSERRAVLDNHVAATEDLAARVAAGETPRPSFVLWPENSTDIDPYEDATVFDDISSAVDAVGVPTLVGAMVRGPGPVDVENQGIVWEPGTGPSASYSKTHPVPFGEYIPMRAQLAKVFERLDQIPRDMVPGTEPGLLDLGGTTIGDVICFEVAYDDTIRNVAGGGPGGAAEAAGMLVVQTNNATYMGTGQVEQQFAIARLRAIETGRSVVVVATNGVSGVVGADGEVLQRAPTRATAVLEADVAQVEGVTPGIRWGGAVQWLLVAGALLAQVAVTVLARRRRTGPTTPSAEPAPARAG